MADSGGSFWKSLPGVLTGVAAVLVAIAGFRQARSDPSPASAPNAEPLLLSRAGMPRTPPAGADTQVTVRKGETTGVLLGGVRLTLVNVTSFKGRDSVGTLSAAEFNRTLPESQRLLGRLLEQARVKQGPAPLLALPQGQWLDFLHGLKESKRETITRTPIAHLAVRVDGDSVADRHLLAGESLDLPVRNRVVKLQVAAIANGKSHDEAVTLLLREAR